MHSSTARSFLSSLLVALSCARCKEDVTIPVQMCVADGAAAAPIVDAASDGVELPRFSFFVTSLRGLLELSGCSQGFGGDLRYGETGVGAGLRGADRICAALADRSMPGASRKRWRAFLSASDGGDGTQAHAIDRVGDGPWYDRLGRVVATNRASLLAARPVGADPVIANDLPNEMGVPNHAPDPGAGAVDNRHVLTGSDTQGRLLNASATCRDWTSARGLPAEEGRPRVGLSWPRGSGRGGPSGSGVHWLSALDTAGCAPGVQVVESGPPDLNVPTVGSGGGYGAFYCFALAP